MQNASISWDVSVRQILIPLFIGGKSIIISSEKLIDNSYFNDTIIKKKITIINLVPS